MIAIPLYVVVHISLFDWAKFRRTKGAIKLHLLLDHDGYLPSFAVITEGKVADVKVVLSSILLPGLSWSMTGAITIMIYLVDGRLKGSILSPE